MAVTKTAVHWRDKKWAALKNPQKREKKHGRDF